MTNYHRLGGLVQQFLTFQVQRPGVWAGSQWAAPPRAASGRVHSLCLSHFPELQFWFSVARGFALDLQGQQHPACFHHHAALWPLTPALTLKGPERGQNTLPILNPELNYTFTASFATWGDIYRFQGLRYGNLGQVHFSGYHVIHT